MTTVRHVSQCCSMLSITLLLQVPQTIPIRYVFGFVREIILLRVVHISLRSLHRVQCVRLLLFYCVIFQSVIFQSCKFQSCKFSYPIVTLPRSSHFVDSPS